jgi:rare lipoprotein A
MRRFRNWRRRTAALALAPVAVATIAAIGPAGAAERGGAALDASQHQVGPNAKVTLEGHFRAPATTSAPANGSTAGSGDASQPIRIQFRALGADNWHDAGKSHTGRRGGFSERVKVDRSGRFRAVSADGRTTAPEKVRVKSRTSARITDKSPTVGEKVAIRGRVAPRGSRRKVAIKVGGETIHTKTATDGSFRAKWKATDAGERTVHVHTASDRIAAGSGTKAGKVTVFRPAVASYYGPGFYGGALACGGTLQADTVGVANKTLPCGTKLTVRYGHKQVETKVIDRGPYVAGREFDLTEALKNKLGFGSTGTVLVSK